MASVKRAFTKTVQPFSATCAWKIFDFANLTSYFFGKFRRIYANYKNLKIQNVRERELR